MAHNSYKPLRVRGFTLVELMTTLVILTVILLLAVPGLVGMVKTSKVRSAQSELVSSLVLARSEAVKRGTQMQVKTLTGTDFGTGWHVVNPADGTEVRKFPDISSAVGIKLTHGDPTVRVDTVLFNPSGFVTGGNYVFTVCGVSDSTPGYAITIPPIGLADVNDQAACP